MKLKVKIIILFCISVAAYTLRISSLSIVKIDDPTKEIHILNNGLNNYLKSIGMNQIHSSDNFYFFGIYKSKEFVAGICGNNFYGCMTIEALWVDESIRNKGYATKLIEKAEEWGKQKKCKFCTAHTFKNLPALNLYKKLNYQIELEQAIYENNLIGVHLKKKLH